MPLEVQCRTAYHRGFASNPAGATFGPRRMTDFEFVWMVQGNADYFWGNRHELLPEGSVTLCRPGAVDRFRWDPDRPSMHGFFHFDVLQIPAEWPAVGDWPLVRRLPDDDVFRPMLRHFLAGGGRYDHEHLLLSLRHLLSTFVQGYLSTRPQPSLELPPPIPDVLSFIWSELRRDPSEAIGLDALAEVAHLHRASL